jgi:hypothetical protein
MKVEFFNKVNDRAKHRSAELDKLLIWATGDIKLKQNTAIYKKFLKDNPKATRKEISQQKLELFPAITFGGTFDGTGKSEELKEMSGLIVLDFDHVERLNEVRQDLENDITTYLLFISPSGDGLKVIVKHDLKDASKWQYLYQELEEYFANKYYLVTDKSGKDISRMCYIPYIDNLYRKEDSWVWNYTGKFENVFNKLNEFEQNELAGYKKTEISDELYKECFYMSVYLVKNKINLTENYDEWLSYGFSLCTFGENGREIYHNISSVSPKYDHGEVDNKYDNLLRDFNGDKSGINKYLIRAKEAIAKLVNQKISDEVMLPPIDLYQKLPSMLKIPLMKFSDVPKFMALLAGISNVSGILPNLKFKHFGSYEYEANLFMWVIAKQSTGKNTINEMQKICAKIEEKIDRQNAADYRDYKTREAEAMVENKPFVEHAPVYRTLFIGADVTKAGFVKELKRNNGRAIISTTEASTLIGANKTRYGAFLDLILACWGHERYQKNLADSKFVINETYLSMTLASTPDTAYNFFASANVDNGLLSRFLAFEINSENELKQKEENSLYEFINEMIETNKTNFFQLWKGLNDLKEPLYLDLNEEIDKNLFEQYSEFEKNVKYIYKFNPDVIKRMWIMHKRLILIFSALYHYEKYYTFDLSFLNDKLTNDWITNEKLPVDPRAKEISDIIMNSYREAFVRLMFGIEQQKYKNMTISVRNDTITKMKLLGYTVPYISVLFDLPKLMVDAQSVDGRIKIKESQKNACLEFCKKNPKEKETAAKLMGVDIRAVQKWCKDAGIEEPESSLVQKVNT